MNKLFSGLFAAVFLSTNAYGAFIDFSGNGSPLITQNITATAGGPLSGGVSIELMEGQNTEYDGSRFNLTSGSFVFQTGNYIGGGLYSDVGSSFSLFGIIPGQSGGVQTLYTGVLRGPTSLVSLGNGNFKAVAGGLSGTLSNRVTGLYEINSTPTTLWDGGFTVLFNTNGIAGENFTSNSVRSTDLAVDVTRGSNFQAIPEPASVLMVGMGLGVTGLMVAARKK